MLRGLRVNIPRILDSHWPEAWCTYDFLGNAVLLAEQGNFLSMILPWAAETPAPSTSPAQEGATSDKGGAAASSARVPVVRSARQPPAAAAAPRAALPAVRAEGGSVPCPKCERVRNDIQAGIPYDCKKYGNLVHAAGCTNRGPNFGAGRSGARASHDTHKGGEPHLRILHSWADGSPITQGTLEFHGTTWHFFDHDGVLQFPHQLLAETGTFGDFETQPDL